MDSLSLAAWMPPSREAWALVYLATGAIYFALQGFARRDLGFSKFDGLTMTVQMVGCFMVTRYLIRARLLQLPHVPPLVLAHSLAFFVAQVLLDVITRIFNSPGRYAFYSCIITLFVLFRERPSHSVFVGAIVSVFGVFLASVCFSCAHPRPSWVGLFFGLINIVVRLVAQSRLTTEMMLSSLNGMQLLALVALPSAAIFGLSTLILEVIPRWEDFINYAAFSNIWMSCWSLIQCIAAVLMTLSGMSLMPQSMLLFQLIPSAAHLLPPSLDLVSDWNSGVNGVSVVRFVIGQALTFLGLSIVLYDHNFLLLFNRQSAQAATSATTVDQNLTELAKLDNVNSEAATTVVCVTAETATPVDQTKIPQDLPSSPNMTQASDTPSVTIETTQLAQFSTMTKPTVMTVHEQSFFPTSQVGPASTRPSYRFETIFMTVFLSFVFLEAIAMMPSQLDPGRTHRELVLPPSKQSILLHEESDTNRIFFFTFVDCTLDLSLARHHLQYYNFAGIQPDHMHVILLLDPNGQVDESECDQLVDDFGVFYSYWKEPQFNKLVLLEWAKLAMNVRETDWIINANTDEFHEYPTSGLRKMLEECEKLGIQHIIGGLLDRIASDGTAKAVITTESLGQQFPFVCNVTQKAPFFTLMAYKAFLRPGLDGLNVDTDRNLGSRGVTGYRIHHFRWIKDRSGSLHQPIGHSAQQNHLNAILKDLTLAGRINVEDKTYNCKRASMLSPSKTIQEKFTAKSKDIYTFHPVLDHKTKHNSKSLQ